MARTDGSCEEDEDKAQHTDMEEVGGITISRDFFGSGGWRYHDQDTLFVLCL